MAKSFKIKSNQIARAIKSSGLKDKLKKKAGTPVAKKKAKAEESPPVGEETTKTEVVAQEAPVQPKVRARSRSAFDGETETTKESETAKESPALPEIKTESEPEPKSPSLEELPPSKPKTPEAKIEKKPEEKPEPKPVEKVVEAPKPVIKKETAPPPEKIKETKKTPKIQEKPKEPLKQEKTSKPTRSGWSKPPAPRSNSRSGTPRSSTPRPAPRAAAPRLGPTGRHVRDLLPAPKPKKQETAQTSGKKEQATNTPNKPATTGDSDDSRSRKGSKGRFKEFKDLKPKRPGQDRAFDGRDKRGLRGGDDDQRWRKRRASKRLKEQAEDLTIRPSELSIKLPIGIKDLAAQMKLKASQLIQKLFMQGLVITLNDALDDETTVLLLGEEFGVTLKIDTAEEKRLRITDKSIKEEIAETDSEKIVPRAPIVAFMGHVDHGKTSLIDAIRESNLASGEAGAITQHIGAFRCHTAVGDIAILDTPGHEAFSAMRARGAEATDIVVLVVAGDEGMRQQTEEALQHAKAAGVTIIVAINKCDKPGFDPEQVYRQLSEKELLPEAWGGQTITVNTSAVTKEGIQQLLEMLALQAEVLELGANPKARARGSVLESEMHKGLGAVATLLVQNGTIYRGDAVVFAHHWGRVKTMTDEHGKSLETAGPSTPISITGLSGVPSAGEEFIIVNDEKEARSIAEARQGEARQKQLQMRSAVNLENLLQTASDNEKKTLNVLLRADVQGSLEALKVALLKIESDKIDLNIILAGVGEVSESDVQLAASSKAIIIGFHTGVESHAEPLIRQHGVQVKTHNIIYHAVDDVRELMTGLLDKVAEEQERGQAKVLALFKSSALGTIAGCLVTEGVIHRNHSLRIIRDGEKIWSGPINSIKRVKEDVREVKAGVECGIVVGGNQQVQVDDILEAFEVIYLSQDL